MWAHFLEVKGLSYQIKINAFEGPFDLLFHLLEKNEVDIYDIPIAEITAQYLDYIYYMQLLDLDLASEFLVMAANLLAIKAKMLLPKTPAPDDEKLEENYDPRDVLVEKLLEYKKYKIMAGYLHDQEMFMNTVYTRPNEEDMFVHLFSEEKPMEGISMQTLLTALREALDRAAEEELTGEILRDEITIKGKMKEIMHHLFFQNKGMAFKDLFRPNVSRTEIVVTFLAVLELIKLGKIRASQPRAFGGLLIFGRENVATEA